MAVNVKLGVDIGEFKSGIQSGQAILKGLNAEMKNAESTFKATGNAEQKLASQTKTLNSTIQVQKGIADQARQALQQMAKAGVDPADVAYQKLYATMMNAEAGMHEAEAAMAELGAGAGVAADGADKLASGLNGISKKISLDQVISGIGKITDGLENAAKKAVKLGEDIWNSIMDSAAYADDVSTMATRLGLTDTQVQQMMYVADRFEAPVETMAKTWKKLKNNMASDSKEIIEDFAQLGVATHEVFGGKYGDVTGEARDYIDVFWEVGEALMNVTDAAEQERLAQKLLGRSWDEMIPLFTQGREAYEAALEAAPAASEDAVESAAALNDRVKELEKSWDTLKLEVIGAVAPALEKGADALAKVLDQLTAYLQSEDGQKLLEGLGTAVTNLFDDLGNINAEDLANNVTSIITGLTDGLNWLNENWESVKTGLIGVVTAWGALEVTGGILEIIKIVSGLKSLTGISEAGAAAGSTWASAFASAAMKAAPFLAFLYTMLNPSDTHDEIGNNTIVDENGNLTTEGQQYGYYLNENGEVAQDRRAIMEQVAQEAWDLYRTGKFDKEANDYVQGMLGIDEMKALYSQMFGMTGKEGWKNIEDLDLTGWLDEFSPVPVEVDPEAPDNAAEQIAGQVGPITLPVELQIRSDYVNLQQYILKQMGVGHANGLSYVPNEGLYHLHQGERVVPAREVASRSFSSNLYVENMNMGGSMSADALAAAIAGRNRRLMAGYGS